jgi:FeS assembly SUF system protein
VTPFRIRARTRGAVVGALRSVADLLREEDAIVDDVVAAPVAEPVEAAPTAPEPVEAAPAEPEPEATERPAVDPALLLAGAGMLTGDLSATMATRRAEEAEVSSGGSSADDALRDEVIDRLHTIFDPEIPVDIYELGLIYAVDIGKDRSVDVQMTLTSPNCPAAQSLPAEVEQKVADLDWVAGTNVEVVFDPPWTPERMSEEARLELNV